MAVRQLVIVADAMEWDLVRRWAADGKLPVLRRLMEQGASAELSTPAAQLPDTVWTAFATGLNPGRLEKYFYVQYDAAAMGLRHALDDEVTAAPVWTMLSAAGRRVGVADVPHVPRPAPLNGFHLTNWGTHGPGSATGSQPPALIDEIRRRFGPHPVSDCDASGGTPSQLAALRDRILAGVRRHGELFRWLMAKEPCDVFFAGFSAAHCVGHHFWLQPDVIEDVYRAIDREIGELSAAAGPDVHTIVVSGHGMGPLWHASWNLTEILDLFGFGKGPAAQADAAQTRPGRVNPWRLLKMILPGRLQYAIRAALPEPLRDRLLFLWYAGGRDWSGRRAFSVPNNDTVGAIRIAVKGRDKNGLVEPGAEYDRICREIAAALGELTDPKSRRPVARQVTLTREEFSGPFLDRLPDITVLWEQSFAWDSLHSPRFGTLRVRRQDARTGSHTPHGFAVFHGPGVRPGRELQGYSIYDIAPTILQYAAVPPAPHLEGRPIPL